MVEGSRTYAIFLKKPKVILDKSKFSFINDLKIGANGQLLVTLEVYAFEKISYDDQDKRITSFKVIKAEPFEKRKARL